MLTHCQSFLATSDFNAAWRCYQEWSDIQRQLGWRGTVEFAGCKINDKNCWEVLITQELHDAWVELATARL